MHERRIGRKRGGLQRRLFHIIHTVIHIHVERKSGHNMQLSVYIK